VRKDLRGLGVQFGGGRGRWGMQLSQPDMGRGLEEGRAARILAVSCSYTNARSRPSLRGVSKV
jgi:hypothetical protein